VGAKQSCYIFDTEKDKQEKNQRKGRMKKHVSRVSREGPFFRAANKDTYRAVLTPNVQN
jgi:hypothetical protein